MTVCLYLTTGKEVRNVGAETQMLYGMDVQDVLNEAVNNGILRVDEIAASVERMKRDQLLSNQGTVP